MHTLIGLRKSIAALNTPPETNIEPLLGQQGLRLGPRARPERRMLTARLSAILVSVTFLLPVHQPPIGMPLVNRNKANI